MHRRTPLQQDRRESRDFDTCSHGGTLMENLTTITTTTSRPDFSVLQRGSDEELVNAITHGIGLAMAAVGTLVMMTGVTAHGNFALAVACAAYLFTLVAVYAMSTVSHTVTAPKWRMFFRQLDQAFIFLLIVGTYTPYSVANLHGFFWWMLLAFMWCFAL